MRLCIQRVSRAKVTVDSKIIGQIDCGALVLIGIKKEDPESAIEYLINKLIHLRMFKDENDRMNLSLLDKKYSCLIVSQFTLYGDCTSGRRPSFINTESPERAEKLYTSFVENLKIYLPVQTGAFGAYMQVELVNDGPVTFLIDSK